VATIVSDGPDDEAMMDREAASALASADHWFRYWMPYRFVRLGPSDEHVYLPIKRGLKPLGITGHGCFRFDTYRAGGRVPPRSPYLRGGVVRPCGHCGGTATATPAAVRRHAGEPDGLLHPLRAVDGPGLLAGWHFRSMTTAEAYSGRGLGGINARCGSTIKPLEGCRHEGA
jgi:hypothetical protein